MKKYVAVSKGIESLMVKESHTDKDFLTPFFEQAKIFFSEDECSAFCKTAKHPVKPKAIEKEDIS